MRILRRSTATAMSYVESLTATQAPNHAAPRRRDRLIRLCWFINIGLLVVLVVWMWNDRRFTDQYPRQLVLSGSIRTLPGQPPPKTREFWPSGVRLRWIAARVLASAAVVSFLAIVGGLFLGDSHHRRLRSWFTLLTLAAAWLAVATSYDDISWTSSTWSLSKRVSDLDQRYAAPLRREWPSKDGFSPHFGSYTAHPSAHPTLLRLTNTPYEFGLQRWGFDRVTRASSGALRFSLTGQYSGLCLEWHPAGSTPKSYVDGQNFPHTLRRVRCLDANWYATKYGG
jgi:hypothetical protein